MTKDIDEVRLGTSTRWKGKPLLTRAEKLARQRARAAAWREKNRERLRKYFQDYRTDSTHQVAIRGSHAKHRERKRCARPPRQARTFDISRKRAANAAYRRRKPEVVKASIVRSKAAKPELYRQIAVQSALKRRAHKKAAPVERVSIRRVYERDGMRCHLCGGHIGRADRSLDHLIPVVRGGAHAEWNLAAAHLLCNKRRGTARVLVIEDRQAAEAYVAALLSARGEVQASAELFS